MAIFKWLKPVLTSTRYRRDYKCTVNMLKNCFSGPNNIIGFTAVKNG